MIHQQLAAAWAGIQPQDIAFLSENADLRIVVNGIGISRATLPSWRMTLRWP